MATTRIPESARSDRSSGQHITLPTPQTLFDLPAVLLARAFETFKVWQFRYETRWQLERLDAGRLDDIGMSEAQRRAEVSKPFWRA